MRGLAFLVVLVVALAAGGPGRAQSGDDDRGYLTTLLEESLTDAGREVRIEGFAGALSSRATIERLTIADDQGIWFEATDLALAWDRVALLRRRIDIREISAATVTILRPPGSQPEGATPEAAVPKAFALPELPVSVKIEALSVPVLRLETPVLGEAVVLAIEGSADLANGAGQARLSARRTDGREGSVLLSGAFDNATRVLSLDLGVQEQADGIAVRLLSLPGAPSIALEVRGTGPINDYGADIVMATDGQPRLSGQVRLTGGETPEGAAPQPLRFLVDLGGDVATVLAPAYRPFFGPDIRLVAEGQRGPDGATALERLDLTAQALRLSGFARIDPDGWPAAFDLTGRIASDGAAPVVLPVPGAATRVRSVDLNVTYDRARGNRWTGRFDLAELDRPEIGMALLGLIGGGVIERGENGLPGRATARLDVAANGIVAADPALAQALGPDLVAELALKHVPGEALQLPVLRIAAGDVVLSGQAAVDGLDTALETTLDARLSAGDLGRFSALSGLDLSGEAEVRLDGMVALLSGAFEMLVEGRAQDLAMGQPQADRVLAGTTTLRIDALRDISGMTLRQLTLQNPALRLAALGRLSSGASQLDYDARLSDAALVVKGISGPVTSKGRAIEDARGWTVATDLTGPGGLTARVEGLATGPQARLDFKAAMRDVGVIVDQLSGPFTAQGSAAREGADWRVDMAARGPAGSTADLRGLVGPDGKLDLTAKGTAPLALANPALAPRRLRGDAAYDLAIRGAPALSSVSGNVRISGARLAIPDRRLALEDIAGNVGLASGQARLDLTAAVSTGGTLGATGTVALSRGNAADIAVALRDVVVREPRLFRTAVNGEVGFNGPLAGGALISGNLDLDETLISVPESGYVALGEVPPITHVAEPVAVRRTRDFAGLLEPATSASGAPHRLMIVISAPRRIFVRGRGLDAELGGQLRLTGTTRQMISEGRFDLVRGRFSILGQRFDINTGSVVLQGDLDPYLTFIATTATQDGTASVIIEGRASNPEVRFASTPEAPEDQVLAQLLFGRDVTQLSALQALQLANAVAVLAGRGGAGIIDGLRRNFGLDDLDVSTAEDGTAAVRAGRYLSENVYTDVTIGNDGKTELRLNLDVTRTLKITGKAGNDGNTGLGIFFERDY